MKHLYNIQTYKHNILVLHDFKHKTGFVAANQPVLCASCHRSNALAEVGGPGGEFALTTGHIREPWADEPKYRQP